MFSRLGAAFARLWLVESATAVASLSTTDDDYAAWVATVTF